MSKNGKSSPPSDADWIGWFAVTRFLAKTYDSEPERFSEVFRILTSDNWNVETSSSSRGGGRDSESTHRESYRISGEDAAVFITGPVGYVIHLIQKCGGICELIDGVYSGKGLGDRDYKNGSRVTYLTVYKCDVVLRFPDTKEGRIYSTGYGGNKKEARRNACLVFVSTYDGKTVSTIKGGETSLHPTPKNA